jgi:hypothetical protein
MTDRSKAMVWGRSLAWLRVRIPPGLWMFVLCVLSKDKMAKYRTIKTKNQVMTKYQHITIEYKKKSRCSRDFSHPPRPSWGPHCLLYIDNRLSFPVVKLPGRGVNHPHAASAEVKEKVELYFWAPLWAFVAYSRLHFDIKENILLKYGSCVRCLLSCGYRRSSTWPSHGLFSLSIRKSSAEKVQAH